MNLDWTILVAGLVFLITLWALNRLLFRPLFRVLDERKERSEGARKVAADRHDYRKSLLESCDRRIREERQRGYQAAEVMRKQALEMREARLEAARQEGGKALADAKVRVRAEAEAARTELERQAREMSATISSRILEKA